MIDRPALGIVTHCFTERARNMLQLLFSGPGRNLYQLVDHDRDADIGIFDFDCVNASTQWDIYRSRHPKLPTIVLSLQDKVPPEAVFLRKPLASADLLLTIEQLRRQTDQKPLNKALEALPKTDLDTPTVSTRSATTAMDTGEFEKDIFGREPDVDLTSRNEIEEISYDPKRHYQYHISEVIRQTLDDNRPRVIESLIHQNKPVFVTPADGGKVFTQLSDHALRNLCIVSASDQKISIRECANSDISHQEIKASSAKAFLWKIALWSSRGRLPVGTDVHRPMQLRHWPNFTRILVTPNAMRIAALMTSRPISLSEVAKTLGLPQRSVFSFFSAANATIGFEAASFPETDLAKTEDRKSQLEQALDMAQSGTTPHRGFLSRMLGRLMRS